MINYPTFPVTVEQKKIINDFNNDKSINFQIIKCEICNSEDYKYLFNNDCRELNIEFLDLTKEVFDKEESLLNMWVFGLPNHYDEYGYNKIANFVYSATKQE